jgi:hypothetical protein
MKWLIALISLVFCTSFYAEEKNQVIFLPVLIPLEPSECDVYLDTVPPLDSDIFYKVLLLRNQPLEVADKIATAVSIKTDVYDVDANTILAIISVESHFERKAVSYADARGLMQVMPFWTWGGNACRRFDLFDINDNIECGIKIFLEYHRMYGNTFLALCAYNQGPYLVNKALRAGAPVDNGYAAKVLTVKRRLDKIEKLSRTSLVVDTHVDPLYFSL